jgi:hypothetical protein
MINQKNLKLGVVILLVAQIIVSIVSLYFIITINSFNISGVMNTASILSVLSIIFTVISIIVIIVAVYLKYISKVNEYSKLLSMAILTGIFLVLSWLPFQMVRIMNASFSAMMSWDFVAAERAAERLMNLDMALVRLCTVLASVIMIALIIVTNLLRKEISIPIAEVETVEMVNNNED